MDVMLSGRETLSNALQKANSPASTVSSPAGREISCRDVQPWNAVHPMADSPAGRETLSSPLQ